MKLKFLRLIADHHHHHHHYRWSHFFVVVETWFVNRMIRILNYFHPNRAERVNFVVSNVFFCSLFCRSSSSSSLSFNLFFTKKKSNLKKKISIIIIDTQSNYFDAEVEEGEVEIIIRINLFWSQNEKKVGNHHYNDHHNLFL